MPALKEVGCTGESKTRAGDKFRPGVVAGPQKLNARPSAPLRPTRPLAVPSQQTEVAAQAVGAGLGSGPRKTISGVSNDDLAILSSLDTDALAKHGGWGHTPRQQRRQDPLATRCPNGPGRSPHTHKHTHTLAYHIWPPNPNPQASCPRGSSGGTRCWLPWTLTLRCRRSRRRLGSCCASWRPRGCAAMWAWACSACWASKAPAAALRWGAAARAHKLWLAGSAQTALRIVEGIQSCRPRRHQTVGMICVTCLYLPGCLANSLPACPCPTVLACRRQASIAANSTSWCATGQAAGPKAAAVGAKNGQGGSLGPCSGEAAASAAGSCGACPTHRAQRVLLRSPLAALTRLVCLMPPHNVTLLCIPCLQRRRCVAPVRRWPLGCG